MEAAFADVAMSWQGSYYLELWAHLSSYTYVLLLTVSIEWVIELDGSKFSGQWDNQWSSMSKSWHGAKFNGQWNIELQYNLSYHIPKTFQIVFQRFWNFTSTYGLDVFNWWYSLNRNYYSACKMKDLSNGKHLSNALRSKATHQMDLFH